MFSNFYEKVSEALIGGKKSKGYDCLWDLFFNFVEPLTSFKFKNFDHILKFIYVDNVADLSPVNFTKVVPLKVLGDGNCF